MPSAAEGAEGTVFLEKRGNADAFFVMRLLRFHVVPLQELTVVDMRKSLADTFRCLTAEYLSEAVVAVRE